MIFIPRTKLDKLADPEIDWLRAAILERMAVKHVDRKQLAAISFISYAQMRDYFTQSPWDWPDDVRKAVCKYLGLRPIQGVYGQPE